MHCVYVLVNETGRLYYGLTSDLRARVNAHNSGRNKSTRGHEWQLVYFEAFASQVDARRRERQLKRSGQARRWLKERIQGSLDCGGKK